MTDKILYLSLETRPILYQGRGTSMGLIRQSKIASLDNKGAPEEATDRGYLRRQAKLWGRRETTPMLAVRGESWKETVDREVYLWPPKLVLCTAAELDLLPLAGWMQTSGRRYFVSPASSEIVSTPDGRQVVRRRVENGRIMQEVIPIGA